MTRKQSKRSILIDCVVNNRNRYQKANKNRFYKGESVGNTRRNVRKCPLLFRTGVYIVRILERCPLLCEKFPF
nr:MAG TPA: hypothetical protein [Caudoviricetes sp.]